MSKGFGFEEFASTLNDVSPALLYRWQQKFPDFREARNIGEGLCKAWWMNLARGASTGQIKNFNAAAWIFSMKNMFGWRDKNETRHQHEHKEIREVVHQVEISRSGEIYTGRQEKLHGEDTTIDVEADKGGVE